MIFSNIATLAAPSTENGLGLPLRSLNASSLNNEPGLGIRGNENAFTPPGGGVGLLMNALFGRGMPLKPVAGEAVALPVLLLLPLLLLLLLGALAVFKSCRRLFRISSSRETVASLRLIKSVALSLLLRLNRAISR
jgi:hypothetical protein